MGLIVVAGGHGQIALLLHPELTARGHSSRGLIRNPDHAADVAAAGAEPVICDMEAEADLAPFVAGADAVVFAAGAGPGSGPERKQTVDLGAAIKLIRACSAAGVERYLMISAMGAADPTAGPEPMVPYLKAKAGADEALRVSGLAYTIVRPGRLTDEPASGRIVVGDRLERGEIARADVAVVLAASLGIAETVDKTFDVLAGDAPVEDALRTL
ncbi:MAG: hypothetical protein QOH46_345 [Solirubrobacteraceae bacterium]|nr:hypothetical protein [Solirubrobacteraceae bacterium]